MVWTVCVRVRVRACVAGRRCFCVYVWERENTHPLDKRMM